MFRLTDQEFIEIAPQFLGIAFALGLFALLLGEIPLVYGTLTILFLLIVRFRFLLFLGRLIHGTFKLAGTALTNMVLAFLYFTFISAYALLFRLLSNESVEKFFPPNNTTSNFVTAHKTYPKADFKKTW